MPIPWHMPQCPTIRHEIGGAVQGPAFGPQSWEAWFQMEGDSHQERSQRSRTLVLYAATVTVIWAGPAGCSTHAPEGTVGTYLAPTSIGDGSNNADSGDAGLGSFTLRMLIRDFKKYDKSDSSTNPDFHNGTVVSELNVVTNVLGSDGKPIYQTPTNTIKTFGK